jgi:alpha-D-ribose 1-methylphosphonate 5-triphosphate synthase subunit PhnG
MRLFGLSEPAILEDFLSGLGEIPTPVYLKDPSEGLVTLRGRMGGTGSLFNIGEVLVSRTVVEIEGRRGYGYTLAEVPGHSEAAALLDALAEHPLYRETIRRFTMELEDKLREKRKREAEETGETKVEFFTLKRGEDD